VAGEIHWLAPKNEKILEGSFIKTVARHSRVHKLALSARKAALLQAMNSYQILPAHVFVAKAYGHYVDSMVASSTTLTPTEQPTARNSASKHKA